MDEIKLGAVYRDKITSFQGRATAHCRYLTGCHQVLLQPNVKEGGDFIEPRWFDEQRCERVGDDVVELDNRETPGCDIPAPIR